MNPTNPNNVKIRSPDPLVMDLEYQIWLKQAGALPTMLIWRGIK